MQKIGFIDLYKIDFNNSDGQIDYSIFTFNKTSQGYELLEKTQLNNVIRDLKDFYLSLPANLLNFRILEFPFTDREKLQKVIPFELDSLIIGGSGSVVFDFIVIDSSDMNNKILVTYIEKKRLAHIIHRFSGIGIDPPIITSLELAHIIRHRKDNIALELIKNEIISDEERLNSAIEELKSPSINLRIGEFAYTKDLEKVSKKTELLLILLLMLLFIINVTIGFRIFVKNKEITDAKNQMRTFYSSLFPDDKKITDELYQMKSHLKAINERADLLIGAFPLEILENLSKKKTKGVVIDELNIDKEIITIKGQADSMGNLDDMKRSLSEVYKNISVTDIKPLSDNKIIFTIIIKEKAL